MVQTQMKQDWLRHSTGSIIAILIIASTIAIDIIAMLKEIRTSDNLTMMILTGCNGSSTFVLGYYFGSSKSQTDKIKAETEFSQANNTNNQKQN